MARQKSNERELIQASLQGQTQAFGYLVEEYQSLICAITYSATGNIEQSEELAQDVFIKAWKNLAQLQDLGKFKSWICRIARTTIKNWFRSRKRDTIAQAASLNAAHHVSSPDTDPLEISTRREHESLVHEALMQLPEKHRIPLSDAKVIPLSLASGMSQHTLTSFACDQGAVNTAQDGRFTLTDLAPGVETLKVVYPGHAFIIVDNIKIVAGQVTQRKPIVIRPGGTVEGIVYDDKGSPLAGQAMQIRVKSEFVDYSEPPMASVITDNNGFYHFERLPDVPCVIHRAFSSNMLGVIVKNLIPENAKVHVLDFGGKPLVYGSIVIDNKALTNHKLRLDTPHAYFEGNFTYFAQTNALGDFTLRGIPAGPHTIHYAHPVQEGEWIELITFDIGTEDLDLGVINKKEK